MTTERASLRLIGESRNYEPGQTLSGEYFVDVPDPHQIKSAEVSVLWFTEGKGDEDLAVHFFERVANDNGQFVDLRRTQQFTTQLPNSPLSYDGVIVKIHWCVRLRVFLPRGEELVAEQPFQLGILPRGRRWQGPLVGDGAAVESVPATDESGDAPHEARPPDH